MAITTIIDTTTLISIITVIIIIITIIDRTPAEQCSPGSETRPASRSYVILYFSVSTNGGFFVSSESLKGGLLKGRLLKGRFHIYTYI